GRATHNDERIPGSAIGAQLAAHRDAIEIGKVRFQYDGVGLHRRRLLEQLAPSHHEVDAIAPYLDEVGERLAEPRAERVGDEQNGSTAKRYPTSHAGRWWAWGPGKTGEN